MWTDAGRRGSLQSRPGGMASAARATGRGNRRPTAFEHLARQRHHRKNRRGEHHSENISDSRSPHGDFARDGHVECAQLASIIDGIGQSGELATALVSPPEIQE